MGIKIRVSNLPAFFKCASIMQETENPIKDVGVPAFTGTAAHELAEMHVLENEVTREVVETQATKHHVDPDELAKLFFFVRVAWGDLKDHFPGAICEDTLSTDIGEFQPWGIRLTGHPDVYSREGKKVLDWKSGWKEADIRWQLEGYGRLTGAEKGVVVWLRLHEYEVIDLMPRDAFDEQITEQYGKIGKEYNPGSQCQWCPREHECEAAQGRAKADLALLHSSTELNQWNADSLGKISDLLPKLKAAIHRFEEYRKTWIKNNGALPLPDGKEMVFTDEPRLTVDVMKAWPILTEYLSDEALASTMKVQITALRTALKDTQEKGKTKFVTQVLDELKEQGAASEAMIQKTVRRKKNG